MKLENIDQIEGKPWKVGQNIAKQRVKLDVIFKIEKQPKLLKFY